MISNKKIAINKLVQRVITDAAYAEKLKEAAVAFTKSNAEKDYEKILDLIIKDQEGLFAAGGSHPFSGCTGTTATTTSQPCTATTVTTTLGC